jgi:hypothetical protein
MLPYKIKKDLLHSECKSEHNLTGTLLKNEGKNNRNRKKKTKTQKKKNNKFSHIPFLSKRRVQQKQKTRSISLHQCFIMSARKHIPRDATSRRSRKNQVSQAPKILVSLADFLQENWSSLSKPVMSLRMSGNSSAIYVIHSARPPAIVAANLFVSLSRCASRASLGARGERGTRRQTDLRHFSWPVFFIIFWAKSHVISAYKKDFSWTNGPNSPEFQERKKIQIVRFL